MSGNSEKNILKTVTSMAIPAIIEMVFVALVGLVDSYMVSTTGAASVAAVGLTQQPRLVLITVFLALNVAVSSFTARKFGEKNRDDANIIVMTALSVLFVLSVIITSVSITLAPQILKFCGAQSDTIEKSTQYFRIIIAGNIFWAVGSAVNSAQRGSGNTKITMKTNITSNIVNVILNFILINGYLGFPAFGVTGAAIATVTGQIVSCMMSLVSISKKSTFISIPYIFNNKIKPTFSALKRIFRFSVTVFSEQILVHIGSLITGIIAASQGTAAMAVHQVCNNLLTVSFSFGDGVQSAAIALIGRSLGENNPDRAKKYVKSCQIIGFIICIGLAVILFSGSKLLMNAFFKDKEIVKIGVSVIMILIAIIFFQIRQVIYVGSLKAAGDTVYITACSLVSVTLLKPVICYLFANTLGLGIIGVWLGTLADQILRCFLFMLRIKSGKWTNIKI